MWIENWAEFKKRMDCDFFWVKNRYVFRNGATSDGDETHYDPPKDDIERLKLQRVFLQHKHDLKLKMFNAIKAEAMKQAEYVSKGFMVPPPNPASADACRRLQGVILRLKEQMAVIDAELAKQPDSDTAQNGINRHVHSERVAGALNTLEALKNIEV